MLELLLVLLVDTRFLHNRSLKALHLHLSVQPLGLQGTLQLLRDRVVGHHGHRRTLLLDLLPASEVNLIRLPVLLDEGYPLLRALEHNLRRHTTIGGLALPLGFGFAYEYGFLRHACGTHRQSVGVEGGEQVCHRELVSRLRLSQPGLVVLAVNHGTTLLELLAQLLVVHELKKFFILFNCIFYLFSLQKLGMTQRRYPVFDVVGRST